MTSMGAPNTSPPWLAIGVVTALAIVAANLAGYLLYRAAQDGSGRSEIAASDAGDSVASEAESSLTSLAVEQREQGVRALRSGEYVKAIASFEAALNLDQSVADAAILLDVARRLRNAEARSGAEGADSAGTKSKAAVRRLVRRADDRRREAEKEKPALLLVSTVPDRILIEIDGRPVELSPARLELDPGRHRVRLRRGKRVLYEDTLNLKAGVTTPVDRDFSEELASPPPQALRVDAVDGASDAGEERVAADVRPAEPPPPPAEAEPVALAPPTGPPRLVVYWPASSAEDLQEVLSAEASGVRVQVVTSEAELKSALRTRPEGVLARASALNRHGLQARLTATNGVSDYVAASLGQEISRGELSRVTVGIVDELGRRRTPIFVSRLLGTEQLPTLRRVKKVEGLLQLLQFSMAGAVILRESELDTLRARTQQKVYSIPLNGASEGLAVAVVDGDRGARIEEVVLGMGTGTRKALGVDSWTR